MIPTSLAPIVLFVYNRPQHTLQTLEALSKNVLARDSVLYIYADGAKTDIREEIRDNIQRTREIIKLKQWCKDVHIIESDQNKGLAKSIIDGVTEIVNKYGKIIVLEDDTVTSPGFLSYMNDALNLYQNEEKVMHISGYVPMTNGAEKLPETYLLKFSNCWGWATWSRAWKNIILDTEYLYNTIRQPQYLKKFNVDDTYDFFGQLEANYKGTLNTWFVKWNASIFLKEGLALYPQSSLVRNIGFDGSGENCDLIIDNRFDVKLKQSVNVKLIDIKENKYARKYNKRFNIYGQDSSLKHRIKVKLKNKFWYKVIREIYLKIKTQN